MPLICPECMGALELRDNNTTRCTIHGGEYQVLFARQGAAAYGTPPPLAATSPAIAESQHCVQHPHLQATAQCRSCGAYMCDTCTFDAGGGIKVCPTCAVSPKTTLSPKRKKMLVSSFVLAGWCTFVMVLMMAGVFSRMGNDEAAQQAVGLLIMLILIVPAIIGLALGFSSTERRMKTSMATWIAIAWNGVILGGFLLLIIIGLAVKGGR